jgi:hypothetical protein
VLFPQVWGMPLWGVSGWGCNADSDIRGAAVGFSNPLGLGYWEPPPAFPPQWSGELRMPESCPSWGSANAHSSLYAPPIAYDAADDLLDLSDRRPREHSPMAFRRRSSRSRAPQPRVSLWGPIGSPIPPREERLAHGDTERAAPSQKRHQTHPVLEPGVDQPFENPGTVRDGIVSDSVDSVIDVANDGKHSCPWLSP